MNDGPLSALDASQEDIARKKLLVETLKDEVEMFYRRLFAHNVGGEFHPFLEWCGVMSEHLKIVEGLLDKGIDATQANVHTGERLPIPGYQVSYLGEKIECIFSGMLQVKHVEEKENGPEQRSGEGA